MFVLYIAPKVRVLTSYTKAPRYRIQLTDIVL